MKFPFRRPPCLILLLFLFCITGRPAFCLEEDVRAYPASERFGMNLTGITWYVSNYPFWDAMKTARPWRKLNDDGTQAEVDVDARGYPLLAEGETAATWVLNDIYPEGQYTFIYEGTFDFEVEAAGLDIVLDEPGRMVLQGDPDGYTRLRITRVDPEDPPRNFHLWLPGYRKRSGTFHPGFLEHLEPFGTYRFMDWLETNNNPIESWEDRPQVEDFTWMDGVPVEVLLELVNRMAATPWFCVPEAANDDYIERFGEIVAQGLDPSLGCVVEYSNEVFNGSFTVFRHAEEQGRRLGLTSAEERAFLSTREIQDRHRHRYQGMRTAHIARVWKAIFGGQSRRVSVVLTGDAEVLEIALATPVGTAGEVAADLIDRLADNSYWGFQLARRMPPPYDDLTEADIFDYLEKELMTRIRDNGRHTREVAERYGLPLWLYEGGQHLSSYGGGYDELSEADRERLLEVSLRCQRDPRMGKLMKLDWDIWLSDIGAEGYCLFSHISEPSGNFAWGLWEYQGQPLVHAVKAEAFIEYLQQFGKPVSVHTPLLERMDATNFRLDYLTPPEADPAEGRLLWSTDLQDWIADGFSVDHRPAVHGGRSVTAFFDSGAIPVAEQTVFFRVRFH